MEKLIGSAWRPIAGWILVIGLSFGTALIGHADDRDGSSSTTTVSEITKILKRGLKLEIDETVASQRGSKSMTVTSADRKLSIRCNQTVYKPGDLMTVEVTPKETCYLRLFYRDASGQLTQIFPNRAQKESKIKAGEKVKIPGEGAGFKFRVTEPAGDEVLMAISSKKPFADVENFDFSDKRLFKPFKDLSKVTAALKRGLRLEIDDDTSPPSHVAIGVRVEK